MKQRRFSARSRLLFALATAVAARAAHAEKPLTETAAGIAALTAPVARTELRFDVGALATMPAGGERVEARLEIAPRPDYWYAIGVSSVSAPATTATTINSDGGVSTTRTINEALQAGMLDAFDRPRASAYAGLGLRWRDADLAGVFWWLRR